MDIKTQLDRNGDGKLTREDLRIAARQSAAGIDRLADRGEDYVKASGIRARLNYSNWPWYLRGKFFGWVTAATLVLLLAWSWSVGSDPISQLNVKIGNLEKIAIGQQERIDSLTHRIYALERPAGDSPTFITPPQTQAVPRRVKKWPQLPQPFEDN